MTKISTYVLDQDVVGGDKWIGSDIQNQNRTKNFTPDKLASYFNDNQIVNIGMPIQYKYYTLDPLEVRPIGTLTFETEIGSSVPFSTITTFLLSKYTTKQNDVSQYLDFLNQSKVLLYRSNDINQFGFYRILTLEPYVVDPTFFELTVEFIDGNGSMLEDKDYMISLVSLQQGAVPTKTSDLINDGEDGIHPFITAQDVPDALIFTSPLVDTAGTITINQSGLATDGYLSSTDWNIFNGKENVLTFSSPLVRTIDAISIPKASSGINGYLSGSDWETFTNKQSALLGTGFVKSNAGVISYDTNTYYLASNPDGFIISAALTDYVPTSRTLTINGTAYDLTADRTWSVGTVTSVGLTMPVAFSVSNSPITGAGDIAVTAVGTSAQYIRGDGQLATFPTSGGGGSSVTYYLNGSIPSSVAGYQQMDNNAVIGLGTDFSLTGNGLIAQFLTDAGNPNRVEIPGGGWNFEMFFNISSVGGNTKFYVDLLKYDGSIFTLISSGSTNPEEITGGTSVDLYLTSLAVPTTPLLITDRLAIRVYIVDNSGGRTATLHTEDNNLCEIITTFSSGVASLNGLTASTQYFAVGTSGMDFNISSLVDTHTFNLPTASAVNRGALSSADWSTFNSKFTLPSLTLGSVLFSDGTTIAQDNANFFWDDTNNRLGIGTATPNYPLHVKGDILVEGASGSETIWMSGGSAVRYNAGKLILQNSIYIDSVNGYVGIGTSLPNEKLHVQGNIEIGAGGGALEKIWCSGGNLISYNPGTADLSIGNSGIVYNSVTATTIIQSGDVGIGTLTPATKLDVNGVITATGGNSTSWNAKENPLTFSSPLVRTVNTISIPKASGGVNGYLAGPDWLVFDGKQDAITLTTTGTSGAATLVGSTLNIPQYSGGGGSTPVKLTSQTLTAASWTLSGGYYTYSFSNVNVTTSCDVSVTPQNASYLTAYNANVLPFVGIAAGVATFYAQFPPQNDMTVDIVITQTI